MGIDDVIALRNDGAVLLDSREPNDFAAGHLRGAINFGLQRRFAEYAGDVLAAHCPRHETNAWKH